MRNVLNKVSWKTLFLLLGILVVVRVLLGI
jgi:Na+/H+ antiporter NhaD/arsenite permease-like protein